MLSQLRDENHSFKKGHRLEACSQVMQCAACEKGVQRFNGKLPSDCVFTDSLCSVSVAMPECFFSHSALMCVCMCVFSLCVWGKLHDPFFLSVSVVKDQVSSLVATPKTCHSHTCTPGRSSWQQ